MSSRNSVVKRFESGFGEVPKKRGKNKQIVATFVSLVFMAYSFLVWMAVPLETLVDDDLYLLCMYNSVFALPMVFFGAITTKFVLCIFVLVEEYKHIRSRHNNSILLLFKNCFQVFLTKTFVMGSVALIAVVLWMRSDNKDRFDNHWSTNRLNVITPVGVSIITNYMFDFKTLSVVEVSEIHESSNINVTQGLAWSYFTGFLEIILKDLKGTIEKDERWKQELENKRLKCVFNCIVPLNCKVPSLLGESERHEGITFESNLPPVLKDRAGVKRKYTISVYKIDDGKGRSRFVICEYVPDV
ncbi:stimulator of interferon genes protein-like [Antedon mediterranea]|uniref:stimulator of interferon genes protein-like n=1 Tax=Antedon mediterranea TaxID=105859 RepID=UPI003AF9170A